VDVLPFDGVVPVLAFVAGPALELFANGTR